MARTKDEPQVRLVVDPVACDGIAMCAHLAPRLIAMDSWGFPIMPSGPLHHRDLRAARTAVSGCPRNALFVKEQRA
jgi:ferredoxin